MARILINAINLRHGGGVQVVGGLLSKLSCEHDYEVLWSDEKAYSLMKSLAGERNCITYTRPVENTSNLAGFYWLITKFPRWVTKNAPDVVLGVNHHFPSGNIPQIIYHMNVLRFERPKRFFLSLAEMSDRLRDWRAKIALRQAHVNVFESQFLKQVAEKRGAVNNPKVIYIGLDDDKLEHFSPSTNYDTGKILVVTSPAPHKDNVTLINMLSLLVQRQPDINWRLYIAGGKGEESFAEISAHAKELGVHKRIHWLGYVDHSTLKKHGQTAHCLVTASRVESFCMVALEAMSWGCPTVVADATSMPESVEDAGLLASPGDEESFANHVLALGEDPSFRQEIIERGRLLSSKRTWSQAAREFEKLWI